MDIGKRKVHYSIIQISASQPLQACRAPAGKMVGNPLIFRGKFHMLAKNVDNYNFFMGALVVP